MSSKRSVANSLRHRRNLFFLLLLVGFVLLVALNIYAAESRIAFGLFLLWMFGGLIVGFYVASGIHCPYCKSDINGFMSQDGTRWYSIQIMDACWKCHRDLTLPYDKDLPPVPAPQNGPHGTEHSEKR